MTTLGVMKARIAQELTRDDIPDQIAAAIADAIAIYQQHRFRFSDIDPAAPPTFPTVVGRDVYDSADNANISTLYAFDYVFALVGATQRVLVKDDPGTLKLYNENSVGDPTRYAYEGGKLWLSPTPNAVYTITLGIMRRVAAPASDAEAGNSWMTVGERLIRCRAKYELAVHVLRNPLLAKRMSPDPPPAGEYESSQTWRAFKDLKGEGARAVGSGIVRPMKF